jgi:hypothetical protein
LYIYQLKLRFYLIQVPYPRLHRNYDDDYGSGSDSGNNDKRINLMFISVLSLSRERRNEMIILDNFSN